MNSNINTDIIEAATTRLESEYEIVWNEFIGQGRRLPSGGDFANTMIEQFFSTPNSAPWPCTDFKTVTVNLASIHLATATKLDDYQRQNQGVTGNGANLISGPHLGLVVINIAEIVARTRALFRQPPSNSRAVLKAQEAEEARLKLAIEVAQIAMRQLLGKEHPLQFRDAVDKVGTAPIMFKFDGFTPKQLLNTTDAEIARMKGRESEARILRYAAANEWLNAAQALSAELGDHVDIMLNTPGLSS